MNSACAAGTGESRSSLVYPKDGSSEPRDIHSRMGRRLRELRRERQLTQVRMAVSFGIDRTFISDVETGRKSISLPFLEVIALGMKLSLSELLEGV